MARDLVNCSSVKHLKAVKGEVLHLGQTHSSLESAGAWDARTGARRQSGRFGSIFKLGHSHSFYCLNESLTKLYLVHAPWCGAFLLRDSACPLKKKCPQNNADDP